MAIKRNKIENFLQFPAVVRVFDEIDSTNNEAKRRAETDQNGAFLYVTDCQTAGRGRRGHDFYSPKGSGLYFTLALPCSADPADVQIITCAAAVAVCEAVEALTEHRPLIKWVNDIYIDGKKVAGILAELVTDAQNQPLSVIVGIGINLTTGHFPAEFADNAGSIGDVDPNRLCAEITNRLIRMESALSDSVGDGALDVLGNAHYNSIIEKYSKLNLCIGKNIRYTDTDGVHTATAVAVAPDGSLIVEENGILQSLHSGEISILPVT